MEVSNEIKEDIRKTQSDLKNAIRIHQVWVARLHEDENNIQLKSKVKEAEKDIIAIGQAQKLVVDRLRKELELYQQKLRARNKHVNIENDNRYIAQQLRDHQIQYRNRNRSISLLKPSVLNEIQIKTESNLEDVKESLSDSENEKLSNDKENSNHSISDEKYQKSYSQLSNTVHDSRNNFTNALNKAKKAFIGARLQRNSWPEENGPENDPPEQEQPQELEQQSDSDSSFIELTPSPPPHLPRPGEFVTQETFMRLIGLVTPSQKEIMEKKRRERRKRATTSTNKKDFLYENFDMLPKKKKYNHFPYLQSHSDPPQTRSAKLRKQQNSQGQNKSSREGSPSGSSTENKGGWSNGKPAWASSLPASLSVEPVYTSTKKVCHECGRNDVQSLLVWCAACSVWQHTGCGAEDGRCLWCRDLLPDPPQRPLHPYRDKVVERKRLQEKNIQLCIELRKLETRAANLKEQLDEHNAEKRQLLANQIKTQRNLQKLLDFISQFKETSVSVQSTSVSESGTGSEISKSNEE